MKSKMAEKFPEWYLQGLELEDSPPPSYAEVTRGERRPSEGETESSQEARRRGRAGDTEEEREIGRRFDMYR